MTLPERIAATLVSSAAGRLGPIEELGAALDRIGPAKLFEVANDRRMLASVYKQFTNIPERRVPLVELHPDPTSLGRALTAGEFGAWDAALDLVAAAGDVDADRLAGAILSANYGVWPEIGERARALLLRSPSDAALEGLLAAVAANTPSRVDLAIHPHPELATKLHAALRASSATTFEPTDWPTVERWDAMTAAERNAFERGREAAAKATPNTGYASALLSALGRLRHLPAIADLLSIARAHPVGALRQAALTSLLGLPAPEVTPVARAMVNDARLFATGVYFVVRREPSRAFELLSPWFTPERHSGPAARQVACAIVGALRDDAEEKARAPEQDVESCLLADRRWLEVAVAHEKTAALGAWTLLRFFEEKEVAEARARAQAARQHRSAPSSAKPADRLARYKAGQYEAVWRELLDLGDLTGNDALREEADAVARETMFRVRHNIDVLAERLAELGSPTESAIRGSPDPKALAQVERDFGPLPLSLHAFYSIVGSVNFEGEARGQALVVIPVQEAVDHIGAPERPGHGPMYLWIAADESGGAPYSVQIPSAGADAVVLNERHGLPFVAYLRVCLEWGGFPGLQRKARKPRALLTRLTKDLLPF